MYQVTQFYYDNGKVETIIEEIDQKPEKPTFEHKKDYDIYRDYFWSHNQAVKFAADARNA